MPPWSALLGPEALLHRLEEATRLLPPDLEARAWAAARAAAEPGRLLDPEALVEAVRDPLGALGRALGGASHGRAPAPPDEEAAAGGAALDPAPAAPVLDGHSPLAGAGPSALGEADPSPSHDAELDVLGARAPDAGPAPGTHPPPPRASAPPPGEAAPPRERAGQLPPLPQAGSAPQPRRSQPPHPSAGPPTASAAAGAAVDLLGAFARATTRAVTAFAAEIGAGGAAAKGPEPPGLADLGHEAGSALGRTARAAAEAAREVTPGLFGALGRAGEAMADSAALGLAAFERTVGGALGGGFGGALQSGLREAGELGRSAAHGLLRPFVPGLAAGEHLADAFGAANRARAWLGRRARGEGASASGLDHDLHALALVPLRWAYRLYFRGAATGLEHLPAAGPALIVANQAGLLPLAGALVAVAAHDGTAGRPHARAPGRSVRVLLPPWLARIGGASALLGRLGALPHAADRLEALLAEGELCAGFPEGSAAVGKPYRRRAAVLPFVEQGLFRAAVRAGAPVIPCAIAGLEAAQPAWTSSPRLGRALGLPSLPITPSFPWLGPLGLVPFPARVRLAFGAPLAPRALGDGAGRGEEVEAARDLAERAWQAVRALRAR